MNVQIKGKFQLKRIYQGKEHVFHTMEEFGEEYPHRIQLASEKEMFRETNPGDVIELIVDTEMREFVKNGSRNTIFYVESINYSVYALNLTKKGGDK